MNRSLLTRRTATATTLSMLAIGRVHRDINRAFVAAWTTTAGETCKLDLSHARIYPHPDVVI